MATSAATASPAPALAAPGRCAMCGAPLAGVYCQACGQPSRAARRTLRDALVGQTGRTLRTLRLLVTRPGELAREIDEGRDRDSVRPLTLLLHVIAFFFLLSSLTDFRLQSIEHSDASGRLATVMTERAAKAGVARELYVERVERRFQSAYTLLIAASSLVYGAAVWLTHRSSGKAWLVHAAAAIHFMCFVFVLSVVAFAVAHAVGASAFENPATFVAVNAAAFGYLALMLRRIYAERWPATLAKSALVLAAGSVSDVAMFVASLNVALLLA